MPQQLSPHFTLEEMVLSQTAIRLGLNNTPNKTQVAALQSLCVNVLEPLRTKLGKPIKISSGYRSPLVNRAVGGSPTSQHMKGEAADILVTDMTVQELFDFILKTDIKFDQIIQEFNEWVHISHRKTGLQRHSILYASHDKNGNVVYTKNKPAHF